MMRYGAMRPCLVRQALRQERLRGSLDTDGEEVPLWAFRCSEAADANRKHGLKWIKYADDDAK